MFEEYNNKVISATNEYQDAVKNATATYQMELENLHNNFEMKKLDLFNEYQETVKKDDELHQQLISESTTSAKAILASEVVKLNDMDEQSLVEYARSLGIKASVKDARKDTEDKIISKLSEQ